MAVLTQQKLRTLSTALAALTDRCYHYRAPDQTRPSYVVWAEDGTNDLLAGNIHAEGSWEGTIDLFTRTEFDELADKIPEKLEDLGCSWSLNSVQVEDSGLIHYEWLFNLV